MAFSNIAMFVPDLLVDDLERLGAYTEAAQQLVAEVLLLAGELFKGHFKIARNQGLHLIAVKANELAQEFYRQQILPFAFFLEDNLGQDRAGDVFTGSWHHRR